MRPTDTTPAVPAFSNGHIDPSQPGPNCKESAACPGQVLLIDSDLSHAARLSECLRQNGLSVELSLGVSDAARRLKRADARFELLILHVSDPSQPWLRHLRTLNEASHQSGYSVGPRFLCVSRVRREPLFEFRIEQMGGRLVYER